MKKWILGLSLLLSACMPDARLQNNAANTAFRSGDYRASLELYQSALINDPENSTIYLNAAQSFAAEGELALAVAAYEQAILRGSPTQQAAANYNLGNLYFESQQIPLAIEAYKQSLRLDPQSMDARYNLELALAFVGQPTPTPMEMQTNPDESTVDDTSPPTPVPGAGLPPTPSPTPEIPGQFTPEAGSLSPDMVSDSRITPNPFIGGELDVEAARRLMEEMQFEQDNIGLPRQFQPIATPGSVRDW